ncbi:hypothetical protein TRFO_03369 [Tritrichomonas foetus]|uniref:Nucleoporin Nup54 alpha-helical domain-containing protein n=1 Tax=Tritrichomonas foetus TaxID=1144522 RepID=A0A1J4KV75_9EUKA|nr:hypothetical protein TRFO_03369 [Tritrichomonas foetus]|eukprot:OHT13598.1 hypothetical protein TRFO_03369 [Tritrichomonas foetus]
MSNTGKTFVSLNSGISKTTAGTTNSLNQKPQNSAFSGTSFGNFGFGQPAKPAKPPDPLFQRLYKIRDSYNKETTSYRFYHVAFNVNASTSMGMSTTKPNCIEQSEWNKYNAIAKQYPMVSMDSMIPSQICGFEELQKRSVAQKEIVGKMKNKLDSLKIKIANMRSRYDECFLGLLQDITNNSHLISEKLMDVLKSKEIAALPDLPFTPQEHELFDRLQKLEREVYKPNRYVAALNALNLKATMICESRMYNPEIKLPENEDQAEAIIQANHNAIEALVKIITNMKKTTSALESTLKEAHLP